MATILGIDPGSRKTGFGVIKTEGTAAVYVTSGIIRLPVDQPIGPRLGVLFSSLNSIIDEFHPDDLAIEQVFLARNPDAALKLGHARGAAMAACVHRGMTYTNMPPVKLSWPSLAPEPPVKSRYNIW